MKTINFLIIAAGVLFLFGCGNNDDEFDASGTFEATEIIVSSEASGKILEFNITEGEVIEANKIVGFIDSLQLHLKKLQLQASRGAVQSRKPDITKQIAAIKQQIVTAQKEKLRIENLVKANAANQKQLDDIIAQLAVLEKQLDAQESSLSSTSRSIGEESSALEIQVAQLEDQLRKCKIVNPIHGTVLAKYAEQSEITSPGKALYKIADTQNMFLRTYITAGQLGSVNVGNKVKVFIDASDDEMKEYSGEVVWISNKAEFTPKTIQTKDERANLVYAVKVAVKNDGLLRIGMYGEIKLK